ncbi:MAG: DnaB-like helicase C-terminal domain-containing protein [Kofleriaceae bacterium]
MAEAKVLVKQYFQHLDAKFRGAYAIHTGVPLLDDAGGLHPGELAVLAAPPGVGKTVLATLMACHAATSGTHVLWFALCETAMHAIERFLRVESHTAPSILRTARVLRQDMTNLTYAAATLSRSPLEIVDDIDFDAAAIRERVEQWRQSEDGSRGLIVIDYLQLIASEHDPIAALRSLLGTAKQTRVAMLLLSQHIADLRERTAIEGIATATMYLRADLDVHELVLAKHRYARTPAVETIRLDGKVSEIESLELSGSAAGPAS